jgi:hypothetical protein
VVKHSKLVLKPGYRITLTSTVWGCNQKRHAYSDLWVWEWTDEKSTASTIYMQILLSLSPLLSYWNRSPSFDFEIWSANDVWVAANWWDGSWPRQHTSVPYDTDILCTYDYSMITIWLQYDYSMITSTNTYLYKSTTTTAVLIMTGEFAFDLGSCLR